MQVVIEALVARLPARAQRYAKALVPVAVAASVAAERLIVTGQFDGAALFAAIGGAVTALLVAAVPNRG